MYVGTCLLNGPLGWLAILLGLLAGAAMGLRFHDADWLGGYASFPRRLLRLGHVALVALGALNVLFAHAAAGMDLGSSWLLAASVALAAGAFTMPACCAVVAFAPRLRPAFALPVACVATGVGLALVGSVTP